MQNRQVLEILGWYFEKLCLTTLIQLLIQEGYHFLILYSICGVLMRVGQLKNKQYEFFHTVIS